MRFPPSFPDNNVCKKKTFGCQPMFEYNTVLTRILREARLIIFRVSGKISSPYSRKTKKTKSYAVYHVMHKRPPGGFVSFFFFTSGTTAIFQPGGIILATKLGTTNNGTYLRPCKTPAHSVGRRALRGVGSSLHNIRSSASLECWLHMSVGFFVASNWHLHWVSPATLVPATPPPSPLCQG